MVSRDQFADSIAENITKLQMSMDLLRSVSLVDVTNENNMCIVHLEDDTNLDNNIKYFDAWQLVSNRGAFFLNLDHNCLPVQKLLSEDNDKTTPIHFLVRNTTIPILKRRIHLITMYYNHLLYYNLLDADDDDYIHFEDLTPSHVAMCACLGYTPVNCIQIQD